MELAIFALHFVVNFLLVIAVYIAIYVNNWLFQLNQQPLITVCHTPIKHGSTSEVLLTFLELIWGDKGREGDRGRINRLESADEAVTPFQTSAQARCTPLCANPTVLNGINITVFAPLMWVCCNTQKSWSNTWNEVAKPQNTSFHVSIWTTYGDVTCTLPVSHE